VIISALSRLPEQRRATAVVASDAHCHREERSDVATSSIVCDLGEIASLR